MGNKIFLIERTSDLMECRYYAEHGNYHGMADAIGYDTAAHARKFLKEEDAQKFIDTELPEWSRACHKVISLDHFDLTMDNLSLASSLYRELPISDEMLNPTMGRLRIWRR